MHDMAIIREIPLKLHCKKLLLVVSLNDGWWGNFVAELDLRNKDVSNESVLLFHRERFIVRTAQQVILVLMCALS